MCPASRARPCTLPLFRENTCIGFKALSSRPCKECLTERVDRTGESSKIISFVSVHVGINVCRFCISVALQMLSTAPSTQTRRFKCGCIRSKGVWFRSCYTQFIYASFIYIEVIISAAVWPHYPALPHAPAAQLEIKIAQQRPENGPENGPKTGRFCGPDRQRHRLSRRGNRPGQAPSNRPNLPECASHEWLRLLWRIQLPAAQNKQSA